MMLHVFWQSPFIIVNSPPACALLCVAMVILLTWNRLFPIGIVVFRYLMVCHATFCHSLGGERRVWQLIRGAWTLLCLASGIGLMVKWKSSKSMLRCLGREELFRFSNLEDFLVPALSSGSELSGPFYSPIRLFINICQWSFLLVVPLLYGVIFKFRKAHDETIIGISESERQRRNESNRISTEINFAAWLIEVFGTIFFILPVSITVRYQVFRVAAMGCPPLFYIMAAEKEKIKPLFKALFSRSQASVSPTQQEGDQGQTTCSRIEAMPETGHENAGSEQPRQQPTIKPLLVQPI